MTTVIFPVSVSKLKALKDELARLGISESDLDEQFVRSGGHGGQKVNKTSTCVWLTHRPSGMSVKCQISRNQSLNRYKARALLCEKISAQVEGERSKKQQAAEKIRRQKRRRSRRAKEKMLYDKHHRSQTKAGRKEVGSE